MCVGFHGHCQWCIGFWVLSRVLVVSELQLQDPLLGSFSWDKFPLESDGIYKLECQGRSTAYVGQTSRTRTSLQVSSSKRLSGGWTFHRHFNPRSLQKPRANTLASSGKLSRYTSSQIIWIETMAWGWRQRGYRLSTPSVTRARHVMTHDLTTCAWVTRALAVVRSFLIAKCNFGTFYSYCARSGALDFK